MKHPNAARVGRKKGFTLMEMLIVIAIIAVLVAIAIPTISAATEKAARAVDMANARALQAMLAAMILQGDIEFPDARVAPSEAEIGVWILVCKDTASYPNAYYTGKDSTFFCGANTGVSISGATSVGWNQQLSGFRQAVVSCLGGADAVRSHSNAKREVGGVKGWDWYNVEYAYDPATKNVTSRIYSGFAGQRSSFDIGKSNMEIYMGK